MTWDTSVYYSKRYTTRRGMVVWSSGREKARVTVIQLPTSCAECNKKMQAGSEMIAYSIGSNVISRECCQCFVKMAKEEEPKAVKNIDKWSEHLALHWW